MLISNERDFIKAGKSAIESGKIHRAILLYTLAIDSNPAFIEAYLLRSAAYLALNKTTKACEDRKTAFDISPESALKYLETNKQQII